MCSREDDLCESRSSSLSLLMSHLRLAHASDADINLSCPVRECSSRYSNVNSVCSHIYRKHRAHLTESSSSSLSREESSAALSREESSAALSVDIATSSFAVLVDLSLPESVGFDVDTLLHRDGYKQKKKTSLFLLQLKEEQMLSQVALNDVVKGCQEVFRCTVSRLKSGINQTFAQNGIDPTYIDEVDSVFDEVRDPFAGLETSYLQEKFIEQELGCVVSWQILLIVYFQQNISITNFTMFQD